MTERLSQLLNDEADGLDIPYPRLDTILLDGRRERRRRRVVPVLAAAAASVLIVGGAAVLLPLGDGQGSPDTRPTTGAVLHGAEAAAAQTAYEHGGAFASGSKVYFGDTKKFGVEIDDPAANSLWYTSEGVLVRHSKGYSAEYGGRQRFTLVAPDGAKTPLDLNVGDAVPDADPTQPYVVRAEEAGDRWDVVVTHVVTGEEVARVPVSGSFTWGGWAAPPVSLSGTTVFVALDDATVAVDWRSGEVTDTGIPGSTFPDITANRRLATADSSVDDVAFVVTDATTGEILLELDNQGFTHGSLSPDGRYLAVLPYLNMNEDNQVLETSGVRVYDIATGAGVDIPTSPVGGYGWTPDGQMFSVTKDSVTTCDPADGQCNEVAIELGNVDTLRLGGFVLQS